MKRKKSARWSKNDIRRFETGGDPRFASVLTCPACGGVMWELGNGELNKYRCHVGHSLSPESLLNVQAERLEVALWSAIRSLGERAALLKRMAARCREHGSVLSERRFSDQAEEAEKNADVIRAVLLNGRKSVSSVEEEADNE